MQATGARGNAPDWLTGYTCKLPTGHTIFGSRLKLICRRKVALHISRLVFLDVFLEVVLDSFLYDFLDEIELQSLVLSLL